MKDNIGTIECLKWNCTRRSVIQGKNIRYNRLIFKIKTIRIYSIKSFKR